MKKLILFILLISLPFTLYADQVSDASRLRNACKKTKNRKTCLRAIKASLYTAKLGICSKKSAYASIIMMLGSPGAGYSEWKKGASWEAEARKLKNYYADEHYLMVMGHYSPSHYRRIKRNKRLKRVEKNYK